MMSHFLKAKHWQLFTLIFGLALFYQIMFFVAMFATSVPDSGIVGSLLNLSFLLFPLVLLLTMGGLLGWLYALGSGLQEQVPVELRRPTRLFKIAVIFPTAYFLTFMFAAFSLLGYASSVMGDGLVMIIILPLHLFAMFCMFYSMYFSAKTIKLAEQQQPVTLSDFIGEIFLIWFFPIGIWFLQPRINELIKAEAFSHVDEDYV